MHVCTLVCGSRAGWGLCGHVIMWVNVKHKVCVYRQAFGSIFTYFWEMCVCVCGCACVFVCVRGLARQRNPKIFNARIEGLWFALISIIIF